jgi:hypothetical protein
MDRKIYSYYFNPSLETLDIIHYQVLSFHKANSMACSITNIGVAVDAKDKTAGSQRDAEHDKTRKPMSTVMWSKARPIMHVVADVADGWERFANALSPTAPFPMERPRLVLASVLAPLFLISIFTSSFMFMKVNGLLVGFGFFGDPLIWRGLSFLNREFPRWQKLLELRNTLLKGVPTNAQLTITLLRIGEKNKAPIPPPPYTGHPPPDTAHESAGQNLDLGKFFTGKRAAKSLTRKEGVSDEEITNLIQPGDTSAATEAENVKPEKKKRGAHLMAAVKRVAKTGVVSPMPAA